MLLLLLLLLIGVVGGILVKVVVAERLLLAVHEEQRIPFVVVSRLVDEVVIVLHNQPVDVVRCGRVLLVDC